MNFFGKKKSSRLVSSSSDSLAIPSREDLINQAKARVVEQTKEFQSQENTHYIANIQITDGMLSVTPTYSLVKEAALFLHTKIKSLNLDISRPQQITHVPTLSTIQHLEPGKPTEYSIYFIMAPEFNRVEFFNAMREYMQESLYSRLMADYGTSISSISVAPISQPGPG